MPTRPLTSAHPVSVPSDLLLSLFLPFLSTANLEMNESSRWTEEEMETAKKGKTQEVFPSPASTRWSPKALKDENRFLFCARASDVAATSCLTRSNCHVLLSCERVCVCACVSFSRDWIFFALWNSSPPPSPHHPVSLGQGSPSLYQARCKVCLLSVGPLQNATVNKWCLFIVSADCRGECGSFLEVSDVLRLPNSSQLGVCLMIVVCCG